MMKMNMNRPVQRTMAFYAFPRGDKIRSGFFQGPCACSTTYEQFTKVLIAT